MSLKFFRLLAPCVVLLIGVSGCGSEESASTTPSGKESSAASNHETPADAYAAFKKAAAASDWKAAANLMSPQSQAAFAGMNIMMSSFSTMGDEAKGKSLEALMKKHGIDLNDDSEPPEGSDPMAAMEEMTKPIKDLPGFIAEVSAWIEANGDDKDGPFADMGELKDVAIDGDSAKANVAMPNGDRPIEFRKIDGSWRVHLPMDAGPGGAPGGP